MLQSLDETSTEFVQPLPSSAERDVALSSTAHFCGHVVIGGGTGDGVFSMPARIVQIESHLELCWTLCLSVRPDVVDLREQVAFEWFDEHGEVFTHYFDLVITLLDGTRLACTVRPVALAREHFRQKIAWIAHQVRLSGFAVDVRLLTDQDLNPVELDNAWLLHAVRVPDMKSDSRAAQVLADMSGCVSLAKLTQDVGRGAAGFRALLRLVRSGHLRLLSPERVTSTSMVYKRENP